MSPRELDGVDENPRFIATTRPCVGFFSRIVLRTAISDNCQMELIGASVCCNLQGQPLTVVSYMASCRSGPCVEDSDVFSSRMHDRWSKTTVLSTASLTAQSFENLLHCDVEPSSDIMIVSGVDLPSKPSSKYINTSHSLQPESSAQPSPTSDSILCTAHPLLETCCHTKAKLLILTTAYPGAWEVLFHVEFVQCFTHAS